mmetsp:Transcript_28415/g.60547  ORF Transcript_28415/g.60547 Transcript_28415/m.60547 type:complete len:611 (+) Transcript_28415:277-2109(+)|eukprot:CAMPEP_0172311568 /NCGR_PEP_ID=MMETSP1058-20130122/15171_1 /TAXON_ID=83371 /ORGANISM="Detonula confervacea, Strain CCMP 353" /LENGTH=610 /DNA_ID=CAMNT_0013024797 /DNA_START=244 /DNA_END=2076 /DNA_ORIENTATION=-
MRFDIAFFLCCCRSFLSSNGRDDDESFYDLLGIKPRAKPDELKRAYKRQSLLMHPDKLAQKGQSVTPADRDRFTRMRHAYEVLSDPRRRETYDAIGERGMKWVEEPLSVDPQELAHNFATSSIVDRSKIFAIFLLMYFAVFIMPIFVCLMADGTLGEGAKWVAVLTPLWVWDVAILFYHSRVIFMGAIKRPDHIPEEEWVDPLPMWKRLMAMVRFACLVLFQVLLALRLDGYIAALWSVVFIPMYLWDTIALRRKVMLANMSIVTFDELELVIGKKMSDCTAAEREEFHRRFIVVSAKSGAIYDSACQLREDAKMDIIRILARVIFTVLVVLNLDLGLDWSWWLVFLPIFALSACIVGSAFRTFAQTQVEAVKKDPAMFGEDPSTVHDEEAPYTKMDGNKEGGEPSPLTNEEKEELKAKVAKSAYRAVGTCASQCFFIVIMCVVIGKIEGASYSSLVIISPFLAAGGVLLCCLACTIFCISEVDENAGMAEFDTAVNQAAAAASGYGATEHSAGSNNNYSPPTQSEQQSDVTGAATSESDASSKLKPPPSATWNPDRGEIWENATVDEGDKSVATADEEQSTKEVTDAQPTIVEEIPSIPSVTSSQCDLD